MVIPDCARYGQQIRTIEQDLQGDRLVPAPQGRRYRPCCVINSYCFPDNASKLPRLKHSIGGPTRPVARPRAIRHPFSGDAQRAEVAPTRGSFESQGTYMCVKSRGVTHVNKRPILEHNSGPQLSDRWGGRARRWIRKKWPDFAIAFNKLNPRRVFCMSRGEGGVRALWCAIYVALFWPFRELPLPG